MQALSNGAYKSVWHRAVVIGERCARAHVGGIFPVPLQQRGDQPRGRARRPRRGRARVPELHLRRVLRQVLEQEPGRPRALPGAFHEHPVRPVNAVLVAILHICTYARLRLC
jgi:hypothetical protein